MNIRDGNHIKEDFGVMIVKITVMLVLITAVYCLFWKAYITSNPSEAIKLHPLYPGAPRGFIIVVILVLISIIGIFASTIYLLFVRWEVNDVKKIKTSHGWKGIGRKVIRIMRKKCRKENDE